MESTLAIPQTSCARLVIERLLGKALLTAHLLTGSAEQAQSAAMEAVNSWNPHNEAEADLCTKGLQAAVKVQISSNPSPSSHTGAASSHSQRAARGAKA
jgi:hypothetical protein